MIAYQELIELETSLINIDSIRKTLEAVAAGIATIPSEGDKTDIVYFLSESLNKELQEAFSSFHNAFDVVRNNSYKAAPIDNT
jgi:hypothetical protein